MFVFAESDLKETSGVQRTQNKRLGNLNGGVRNSFDSTKLPNREEHLLTKGDSNGAILMRARRSVDH